MYLYYILWYLYYIIYIIEYYFTTQKDDQALIRQESHHHGTQQKLQILRHIASEKLASKTWEKDKEPFYSQDKATVKMDRFRNPKVFESEDISQMLCKLLKLQAAPKVDLEPFDGNTLNYHYSMALFKKVVKSKIDDPRGRLTRLIKYTTGDTKELIKHCIQVPSNEGFKNAKYLLEKVYGNLDIILVSYRREIKQWPQIKFRGAKGFIKFHNFPLKCRSVFASQRWNALDTPHRLCIMISKLAEGIMARWTVLKIRKHQHRKPNLNDITDFLEDETILMNDPLLSREALGEFNTKPERHSRQRNTNSYVVKSKTEQMKKV